MQCFLQDAGEKQANSRLIRIWISDMRGVAQDAEDAIETFILKVDHDTPTNSIVWPLGTCFSFLVHKYNLYRVGKEIESIQKRLQDIKRRRQLYGIQTLDQGSSRSEGGVRKFAHWKQDNDVVGLEKDVQKLLQEAIFDDNKGLSVATIVGMGGIGKSTLAKKIYNHAAVVDRFDCRAWVVVSSEFRPRQILKELMLQLPQPGENKLNILETVEKLEEQSLQQMVYQWLEGKTYLIVVDDVWEGAHWEYMEDAFPDQDKASRLLLTSRNRVITKFAPYVHEMELLNPKESWELLLRKAFIHEINTESKCPQELENIAMQILKRCDGLPLAIAVVGGILVDKSPAKTKWEKVLKEISSHLGKSGSNVPTVLEISYRNLSPQLKSCFLYLGFFKEDAVIRAERLVRVWIAQGLVPQENGEETMEEIGRHYLDKLINRNMVQIKDMKGNIVKSCHVHDVNRALSITKAKEEISFERLREDGNSQSLDKPRHRAMYCNGETFIYSAGKNKHLRSLFFHGVGKFIDVDPSYCKCLELLKVLDFEDFELGNLPDKFGALTGFGMKGCTCKGAPMLIGSPAKP